MSSLVENATIKIRRDSAANWTSNNPTPASGEWCYESDTGRAKIGDGSTAYNSLSYAVKPFGLVTAERYDSGWIQFTGVTNASININHGLTGKLHELDINISLSSDGTDANSISVLDLVKDQVAATTSDTFYGSQISYLDDDNFTLRTCSSGVLTISGPGGFTPISTSWYYRVVVTKLTIGT